MLRLLHQVWAGRRWLVGRARWHRLAPMLWRGFRRRRSGACSCGCRSRRRCFLAAPAPPPALWLTFAAIVCPVQYPDMVPKLRADTGAIKFVLRWAPVGATRVCIAVSACLQDALTSSPQLRPVLPLLYSNARQLCTPLPCLPQRRQHHVPRPHLARRHDTR